MNSNLESKINLIYQFLYENLTSDCYNISRINLKNINIDDIKISLKEKNRNEFVEDFLNAKFQLSNHMTDENNTIFKRITDGYHSNVIISPYKINEKEDDIKNKNNNDSLFSYALSSLVLQEKTKNIQLPIINLDLTIDEIKDILKSYPVYKKIQDDINDDNIKDIISVRVREGFNYSRSIEKYLDENDIGIIKEILFQIIHCLAIIQKDYPTFRHNNFTIKNIFVEKQNISKDKQYIFDGNKFNIKDSNLIVKLALFDDATCEDINGLSNSKNKYSDIFKLLKSIKDSLIYKKLDNETKNFIDENLMNDDKKEYMVPKDLLNNKYFNAYKKISNKTYMSEKLTNKFKHFNIDNLDSDNIDYFGNQEELQSEKSEVKLIRREKIRKKSSSKKHSSSKKQSSSKNKKQSYKNKEDSTKSNKYSRKIKTPEQLGGMFRRPNNPYKKERNDPMVTNDARDTYNKFKKENPPMAPKNDEPPVIAEQVFYDMNNPKGPGKVLAEQKVYDTNSKFSKPGKPSDYVPTEIPMQSPFNAHYHPLYPYESKPNTVHVVKPVNITFSNPVSGNHMALSKVYEDMLPGDQYAYSLRSVYERKELINFIRGIILEMGDGEEISISTGGKKSLLSFIRLLEINPYNLERNPYRSLSKGFLLYSSAYPVRFDAERNHLGIAKDSLGINVRIYELTRGAYEAERIGKNINCDNFDLWREIKYYEYVREDIIKKKISPNFVAMYLYTTDSHSRINYDQLNVIRLGNKPTNYNILEQSNINKINNLHEIDPLQFLMINSYGMQYKQFEGDNKVVDKYIPSEEKKDNMARYLYKRNYIKSGSDSEFHWTEEGIKFLGSKNYYNLDHTGREKPTVDSKVTRDQINILLMGIGKVDYAVKIAKSLVVLTESPNNPLLNWASPSSDNYGTVQKMTETGYHTPEVWRSIIFQMVYTFAVLQNKGIYFKKLSLENNFFIKDLFTNNERRDHWIYKVNDIEFYIPNYGYLLMFDSKYVDIMDETVKTVGINDSDDLKYKIVSSNLYGNKNDMNAGSIDQSILSAFRDIVNPDSFTNRLDRYGGLKPDSSVIDLLRKIYNHTDNKIENYLQEFFTEFMHNRIGTRLTVDEMSIIGNMYINNFKKGELVAYRKGNGEYLWAVFLGQIVNNPRRCRIALNNEDGSVLEISIGSLRKLPNNEVIKQTTKNRVLYDSDHTIETYSLKN